MWKINMTLKINKSICVFILVLTSLAQAAEEAKVKNKVIKPITPYWRWGYQLVHWQEELKATDDQIEFTFRTQVIASSFQINYERGWGRSRRWLVSYPIHLILGIAQGSGGVGLTQNNLKNQEMVGLQIDPAIRMRTSRVSDIGFHLSGIYRYYNWNIKDETGLKVKDNSPFSFGAGLTSRYYWSKNSNFIFGLFSQYDWPTAFWRIGIESRF